MSGPFYVVACLILFAQLMLRTADGVAPDDFSITCRTDFLYRQAHDWIPYANDTSSGTWKVLIDQYDYQSVIGFQGVWSALDADTQPPPDGRTFSQGSGGTCSYQIRVSNSYQNPNSNNWVFTQAIDYLDAVELIVNATVRFSACVQRRSDTPPCRNDYVILQRYDTNTLSETERVKPTNYQPYKGTSESSRLEQDQSSDDTTIIERFRRPANFNYTYLGLQDIGTHGIVSRIFMYYEVCPGRVEGLVTYPEVPRPGTLPGASSRTTRLARCAEHSHNTTSLETYAYQDRPEPCDQRVTCICDAGYEENGRQCIACTPGKYRSTPQNSSCVDCPANSNSLSAASESCNCNAGYYRVSGSEGIGVGCTAPPPPVSNCNVSQQFDTAITIRWRSPVNCGGRSDCYYQIRINNDSPRRHSPVFRPNNQETFTVENLQPDTTYSITVSIHNGVSDQDPDNARNRECVTVAKTLQGSVFMLGGVTFLNNTAVLLEDIDANSLDCTTASAACCTGRSARGNFYYPDGDAVLIQNQATSSEQSLYMTHNQGSISLRLQAGDSPPLGRYRCEIPDGRGTLQNLYIRIGTAISPPGPNTTTDEPTMISVAAVVFDAIVLDIPNSLSRVTDKVGVRIEERQAPSDSAMQTKAPIVFTAPITTSSPRQQVIVTIPQSNITAVEKRSAYFVKIKPIYVNGSQGDYGRPYFFDGTIIRDTQTSTLASSSTSCINLPIFIGVIVAIAIAAIIVIILILISLCVTCKKKQARSSSHRKGAKNPGFSNIQL